MKQELRKALEAELDRLNARVEAIRLLLETPGSSSLTVPPKRRTASETKVDGRKLRWQNATSEQRKAWTKAIRTGRKTPKRRGK